MHYLLIVTLAMPADASSEQVRQTVFDRLAGDASFCGEGGRFSAPLCDWFVIGGRRSGHLWQTLLRDAYQEAVRRAWPELVGDFHRTEDIERNRGMLNSLWSSFGGAGPSPYLRDQYAPLGYDDDAMRVTAGNFAELLDDYVGLVEDSELEFVDLDGEPVDESFIGRKWIVVIDYHN